MGHALVAYSQLYRSDLPAAEKHLKEAVRLSPESSDPLVALGLYAIGVPYALLWGVLAGILRFVPLVGGWIAGAFPALVAMVPSQ